jgi:hypothetical protein
MPIYTLDPVPTIVARQINTTEDGDLWFAEMTAAALSEAGEGIGTFSDFVFTQVEGSESEFWLEYTSLTEVDGQVRVRVKSTYGYWGLLNGVYNSNPPWFESDTEFQRRFQPFNGLA